MTLVPILIADVDESFFRSVQLALDAHGISHVDYIASVSGTVFPHANRISVDEADLAEARTLIQTLQRPTLSNWDSRSLRILAMLVLLVVAGFVVVWFGGRG